MKASFWMRLCFVCAVLIVSSFSASAQPAGNFRDTSLPLNERVTDLLKQLTLAEKISLLGYQSPTVRRLDIPAYNWWNEALHGVARAGNATIFPQVIGMAASFNEDLLRECANAISTEARAKYNLGSAGGHHYQYMGLTFWSPNINIFRDPRWGRGQETYGEDPYLTGAMGTAFVRGMQGNDPLHLKTAACAKHFAVHSGPEKGRHGFNSVVSEKDLQETYLYAFHKLVNAGVESVMCAYNRVNGEPCCASNTLLRNILRKEWHFEGQLVTDCGALNDIYVNHKTYPSNVDVAAAAIKAGISIDCGNLLQEDVMKAIDRKLLSSTDVDSSLARSLATEVKLGFFDDPAKSPYAMYGADSIANTYHMSLARKMAQQSIVLLKNEKNILPIDIKKYPQLMIVGPNAASLDALLGSYHGVSDKAVNVVEGITKAVGPGIRVEYDLGCDYEDTTKFGGIWAAGNADITVAVLGLTPLYEGEEGDAFLSHNGADRLNLSLPAAHIAYLKALRKSVRTPIILVINAGSAVDVSAVADFADAILLAWYPGQEGGNAIADILFGKACPSGHLPVTFYKSFNEIPPYEDYSMRERTYRYFTGAVQYPFGFGMSYTTFDYSWTRQPMLTRDSLRFSVSVSNTGNFSGDAVVQVYLRYPGAPQMPVKELKAFKRLSVGTDQQGIASFSIPTVELRKWDIQSHKWKLYPGKYSIDIGENAADARLSTSLIIK